MPEVRYVTPDQIATIAQEQCVTQEEATWVNNLFMRESLSEIAIHNRPCKGSRQDVESCLEH